MYRANSVTFLLPAMTGIIHTVLTSLLVANFSQAVTQSSIVSTLISSGMSVCYNRNRVKFRVLNPNLVNSVEMSGFSPHDFTFTDKSSKVYFKRSKCM